MIRTFWFLLVMVFLIPKSSNALCVKASKANLRTKPSARGGLAWTVGKYMPLYEIGRQGNWFKVKDVDGKTMWIASSLVTDNIDCAVIRVPSSQLRSGPGKRFAKTPLGKAYKYAPFKKVGRDGAWIKVQDNFGKKHWVYETNVWEALEYSKVSL